MKKSKMNKNNKVTNANNNKVTNSGHSTNSNEKVGFNTTDESKSFHYDEESEHSFELRDCK